MAIANLMYWIGLDLEMLHDSRLNNICIGISNDFTQNLNGRFRNKATCILGTDGTTTDVKTGVWYTVLRSNWVALWWLMRLLPFFLFAGKVSQTLMVTVELILLSKRWMELGKGGGWKYWNWQKCDYMLSNGVMNELAQCRYRGVRFFEYGVVAQAWTGLRRGALLLHSL